MLNRIKSWFYYRRFLKSELQIIRMRMFWSDRTDEEILNPVACSDRERTASVLFRDILAQNEYLYYMYRHYQAGEYLIPGRNYGRCLSDDPGYKKQQLKKVHR